MSKMGISVLSSYRGGCNFEAVGLSRGLVADYFPVAYREFLALEFLELKIKLENFIKVFSKKCYRFAN